MLFVLKLNTADNANIRMCSFCYQLSKGLKKFLISNNYLILLELGIYVRLFGHLNVIGSCQLTNVIK